MATEVVQTYVDEMYAKFGGSLNIFSDNETEFKNQLFTNVATQTGMECKINVSSYHPQSYGKLKGFKAF